MRAVPAVSSNHANERRAKLINAHQVRVSRGVLLAWRAVGQDCCKAQRVVR